MIERLAMPTLTVLCKRVREAVDAYEGSCVLEASRQIEHVWNHFENPNSGLAWQNANKYLRERAEREGWVWDIRPTPPRGFVRIDGKISEPMPCPHCGEQWTGNRRDDAQFWGFQDRYAQREYDRYEHPISGALSPAVTYDGTPILCHWSRWHSESWSCCGLIRWRDWGGWGRGPIHFYREADVQPTLFGGLF